MTIFLITMMQKHITENIMTKEVQLSMDKVYCPVKQDDIDGGEYLVICDVADRMIKPTVLPEGIDWNKEKQNLCLKCKFHDDIK